MSKRLKRCKKLIEAVAPCRFALGALLLLLVLLPAGAGASPAHHEEPPVLSAAPADDLLPIPAEVAKPRTNEECMKCHKEPHLSSGRLDGSRADLHIELEDYKATLHGQKLECIDCHEDAASSRHCRSGFAQVNCLACHSEIEGLFPFQARQRLAEKRIRIPKRKMVGDSFFKTRHGKALLEGKKDAPNCYDCHTRHYVFGARLERSSVNRANLEQTCSACHKERAKDTLLAKISTFRLQAHRKGNFAFAFDQDNCIDCHQGEAVHGEKVSEAPCYRCHDVEKGKKTRFSLAGLGPFHLFPDYENQYPVWCLRNFYGALLIFLLAGAGIFLLYYILRRSADYYREEGGEDN